MVTKQGRQVIAAVACAIAAGLSGAAHAGDAEGRYAVKGAGLVPCGTFLQMAQQGAPETGAILAWLDGYMSGLNMMLEQTYDLVTWQEGVMPNMLAATCNQMQDQPVAVAASQLVQVLGPSRIQTAERPAEIRVGENARAMYPSVVRGMQQALKDRGQTITVDGDFGPGTQTALRAFQTASGIEASGFPDPRTLVALFTAGAAAPQQQAQPAPQQQQVVPPMAPIDMEPVAPALGSTPR